MARALTFRTGRTTFEAALVKIDRTKIYGSVEVEGRDAEDHPAQMLTLARDGKTLIPLGGTASGYLNTDGQWVEMSDRQPVDEDGRTIPVLPSSFDAPIVLKDTASPEDLLDHPIRLAYHLDGANLPPALGRKLADGAIYRFDFTYRGGPVPDPAFLLTDTDGDLWMLVGTEAKVDFRSYKQAALCAATETADGEDPDAEEDAFDFDML